MAELIPLDYDPFAPEAEAPAAAPPAPLEDRATRATIAAPPLAPEPPPAPPPEPIKPKADYTIPPAPALPTVAFAGAEKPKAELIPLDYDPFAPPAKEKPGVVSNIVRGIGERAVQLVGGTAGTIGDIAEGAGDWLDQNAGKPVWDEQGNFSWRRMTPEETKGTSSWITQKLKEVQKGMSDPQFGYSPGTTWQDVKDAPFTNVLPFAIEQGLVSAPDMYAAVKNAPAYVIEQAGEIGAGRATSEGRAEPTFGDILKAVPSAVISQMMEKIGTEKMFGVGEAALTELKQLPAELLKTLATEGATEAAQQAAQYGGEHAFTKQGIDWWKAAEETLQAGLVGAIFGPAVRSVTAGAEIATAPGAAETGPKADDQPGVAAEVKPEGTPAAVTPAAGEPTPGSLSAKTPTPPAGTEKQPEDATVPVAKAAAVPAGGVHVVTPTAPDPDLAAATAGTPIERPAPQPVEETTPAEEAPEGFDIRETLPEEATPEQVATETSAHEARIRGMFRDEMAVEKQQAALGGRTTVAPAGAAEAAALAAVGGAPKQRTQETLGTGQALGAVPGQPAPVEPAKLPTPQVAAPAPTTALAVETPAAGPVPSAPATAVSGEPALTQEPAAPELPAAQNVPVSTAADVSLRRARAAQAFNQALQTNDTTQIAAAKAEFLDAMQALQRVDPDQFAHFANTPGNRQLFPELAAMGTTEPAAALTQPPAAPPVAQPAAAPVVVGEPKAVEPRPAGTLALPGAKGEALKRRAKPVEAPTELIRREAISAQPTPQPAPAPSPAVEEGPKRPEPTRLSRDAANNARDAPAMRRSTVTELPDFRDTLDAVSAEVVARLRQENPGASPAQIIRDSEPEIVAETTRRLEAAAEAADQARVALEAAATKEGQRKTAQEARTAAMAEATTGQKKERAGAKKGKSATGIRAEGEKATLGAISEELKKPEAERDKLLMAWQAVHARQKILPKNPKPEKKAEVEAKRAEAIAQKQQIQELRAQKAEAAASIPKGFNERAAKAQTQVKAVLEAHPLPALAGSSQVQERALQAHLQAFKAALRAAGIKLADHVDRKHQSMEENLAIFAGKTRDKHDFAMAQMFQQGGFDRDFYGLITNETLTGTGYNEAIGEDKAEPLQKSWTESEEATHLTGTHRPYEASVSPDESEEQMLIRSGRVEAHERAASRVARDEAAYRERRSFEVTRPGGRKVTVTGETRKASDVLREVHRLVSTNEPHSFVSVIQNALLRHLTQLVGNVDVHFVSAADMMQLHDRRGVHPAGLYYNYSAEERAAGARPQVFINEEVAFHADEYAHTAVHELTHAATSLALRENIRGTATLVNNMMGALRRQLSAAQLNQFDYAFSNPAEFIAESFSNGNFQQALAAVRMPEHLVRQIAGVSANRQPSLWDGVVAMVSNAVGTLFGQRGQSYMEQVVRLFPEIATSEQGQRVMAREQAAKGPGRFQRTVPTHPVADIQALNRNFDELAAATRSRLANLVTPKGRMLRDILSTSGQMIRGSAELFGGENNPLERKIKAMLKIEGLAHDLRTEPVKGTNAEDLELAQLDLRDTDKKAWRETSEVLRESSRYLVDPTKPLAHANNGHISKTGSRHSQVRAMHAELQQRWNALPAKAQDVGNQTIDHFRKLGEHETGLHIKHALEMAATKYGAKPYPAGMDINDAIAWIKSGAAAKDVAHQMQIDKDWHAALGKTAASLAKVPMLRKIKGIYVPFMRRGKYFISSTERPFGTMANPQNVPAGAVMDAENRLLFAKRADLDAFAGTYPGQVAIAIKWVDPLTGQTTTKNASYVNPATNQLVLPRETWVATIQNKRVEMSDNASQLKARAKQLQDAGHHASAVGLSKQGLEKAIRDTSPREIQSLINNLEQTTIGQNTVSQQAIANAVLDAHIRRQTSASHVQRGLKRRGILGENEDLLLATRDYNRNFAHHVANMTMAPEMAASSNEVDKYIKAQQHVEPANSDLTTRRQAMNAEVDNRIKGHPSDSSRSATVRTFQAIKQIVYMAHLASPHFSIMNAAQPTMTTLPVLGAKYGPGVAARQMGLAYAIGAGKAVKSGAAETGRALKNIAGRARKAVDNDQFWRNQVAGEADAKQLTELFDEIRQLGFGAASGIEAAGLAELDMNWAEKRLNRLVNIAKALPEAIEGVNRYTTAIAAYRSAVLSGMSHESALRDAALTVEQTQGGYGAANNPTLFRHPLLQPALQFKKYALNYGNLYWRNVANIFSGDAQTRKQAAKTVAGLSLATVAMAGVYGLPLVEPLRWLVFAAQAAGLSDDDWDAKEVAMQKFLGEMIAWATGSKTLGDALAEAQMRGYTRLANVDTSNSFGNDSLFLFGQPKSADADDIAAWMWKAFGGAPWGMAEKSYKALQTGHPIEAIPWPKIIASAFEGYKLATQGTVSAKTGEQYGEPTGIVETAAKVLGFKPASSARQWEGGGATQAKQTRASNAERRTLMARWRNAAGPQRQQIFREEVRAWNASHRNPDDRIQMQDLMSSIRAKKASDKRRARAALYEE